jgi:histidinol phosphatase-like PHP family hydrolase
MPKSARLFDAHVHSPFAYCGENMDFGRAIALAEAFNLDGLAFSEHSGQLYYDNHTYWRGAFLAAEAPYPPPVGARMRDYLAAAAAVASPRVLVGLEADADFSGRLALRPEDRAQAQLLIGAIHQLPELRSSQPSVSRTAAEFLGLLPPLLGSGIQVLAHPFRVFRRAHLPVPEGLFAPTAELLRRHRVAAEINYHTNEPSEEFTRLCLRCGVRLCLGSDAHNLYEVGEFYQHLALLRACGVDGDLSEVLLPLGGSREGGDERERDRF